MHDRTPLSAFVAPRSVAIVGASERVDSVGGQVVRHLLRGGFAGPVYPVNPRYTTIQGLPAFPNVAALPEPPDLVAVAVAAEQVPPIVCGLRGSGVRAAVVFSGGFSEAGAAGADLERDLLAAARHAGIRLIGPNCQGVMSTPNGVYIGFGSIFEDAPLPPGGLALLSQSGGFGFSALILAAEQGIHFGTAISTGNEADVTTTELIDHLVEHGEPSLVCAYVEALRKPADLIAAGERARARRVPIAVWKVGRSPSGQRAAAAHTGKLAGDERLYDGLLRQAGVLSVTTTGEMIDLARAFSPRRIPSGPRLGVLTISGGAGVVLCDHAERAGLRLPTLADETMKALAGVLPEFASVENPVDVTAHVFNRPEMIRDALHILAGAGDLDMICVLAASLRGVAAELLAGAVEEVARQTGKPTLVAWTLPTARSRELAEHLENAGVACYPSPERLVTGAKGLADYGAILRRPSRRITSVTAARYSPAPSPHVTTEAEVYRLLGGKGIAIAPWRLVADGESADDAAAELGYPLVAKGQLRGITHKSELGLVHVGVDNPAALTEARKAIRQAARAVESHEQPWAGLLLQRHLDGAVEVIVSAGQAPGFGPYVMVGLGGLFTEVFDDVAFRVPPLSDDDATAMLAQLRGHALLAGARGRPARDVAALRALLVRLGTVVLDMNARLVELNPVLVLPDGRGAFAADAVLEFADSTERQGAQP